MNVNNIHPVKVSGMGKTIEILAPSGDADSVKAAILAGADAVYGGLPSFNARGRAQNITVEGLEKLIRIAQSRGRRIYLTLNTLMLDSEFSELFTIINRVRDMDIDAIIVQDMGLLYILKEFFPSIEVHASTQMTTHNAGLIEFLSKTGARQVNFRPPESGFFTGGMPCSRK